MSSGIKTESNRSGDELFEIVRFDLTKPFGEIVNQHNDYYASAKDSFLSNTEDILSYGGGTLQDQVTKEINAIEDTFLNDATQEDSYTILNFPEATPLLKLGFYHFREDPRISFYHLVQSLPSLIPLGSLDRMPTKLIEVDSKYLNMRYTDLGANELLIEALEYVIIGGNIALLYRYFVDLRNNDKLFPATKAQGQESRNNTEYVNISTEPLELNKMANSFDHVDMSSVYKHFKSKLVDKKILSEPELLRFIEAAFHRKVQLAANQKLSFSIIASKKKAIVNAFYLYYTEVAQKPHGSKSKYVSLLTNYFGGFNHDTVMSNFSR